jgi:uridine kinase
MIVTAYDEMPCCATLVWMTNVRRFAQLADELMQASGPVRLVGVDGCGGSGKTTFAARLSVAGGGWPIVHTDDFASHDVPIEWWPRMLEQVIEPLSRNERSTYRPYDWIRRQPGPEKRVDPADVVVIEGVGAIRSAWRARLTKSVWVDAPREVRLRRGIDRDGEGLREFWMQWMDEEDRYISAEDPRSHADLIVDGDPATAHEDDVFAVVTERRTVAARSTEPR